MNDLEERLRSDFLLAAAQVEDRIDAEDALLAGQRARSSRRIARTLGVSAVAAVLGLLSWGVLRSAPVLGGHPDPMGTVPATPSRPTPSESVSPYVPTDPLAATFALDQSINGNGQLDSLDSIDLAVKPAGDQVEVRVSLNKAKESIVRHYTLMSGAFWWVALDEHYVLSIVPGHPTWYEAVGTTAKGAVTDQKPLAGINAMAYLTGYVESGGPDSVRGFLWRSADGVAHNSLGKTVPSVEIVLSDDTYWVYRDVALDELGVVSKSGGGFSFRPTDAKPDDLVHGGFGTKPDKGSWSWTQLGTLPPGAHDVNVVTGDPSGEWSSAVLSDGWVVIMARAQTQKTNVITSITYTGADGKTVRSHS